MFPSMVNLVPAGSLGVAKVEHFEVSESESVVSYLRRDGVPAGKYARLYVGGALMMSDTPMEHRSNYEIVRRANGRVLIAGLGLGMTLTQVLAKPEVENVSVVEKYQDVIDLVQPHFPSSKLSIICADILEWRPLKGCKFDTVYFDIWPDLCVDNLDEMATLHRRFASRLNRDNPQCWMGSWSKDRLKYERARQSRNRYW